MNCGGSYLRELVAEHVSNVCLKAHHERLRAILLTGSVARDEGTLVRDGDHYSAPGDAELFLVFRDGVPLPGDEESQALSTAIQAGLEAAGVQCRVELNPVYGSYFRALTPSIFARELQVCGKVIWGEDALRLIPERVAVEPPLEDAFRLVWNRLIELMGAMGAAGAGTEAPRTVTYAALKLFLDMATSLLVFAGRFEPAYRARQIRLHELAAESGWPFTAAEFIAHVDRCTEWKLSGAEPGASWELCTAALRHAARLWPWELARMNGAAADEMQLWRAWIRSQPLTLRARGWLYVVRAGGWHHSRGMWPRWLGQATTGSPRVRIYGAARDILPYFEAFPPAMDASECERISRSLPVVQGVAPRTWQELCLEVFRNYKQFLVGTRC